MSRKCTIHKDVVRLEFEAVVRKRKGHGAAAASGPLEFSEALARHVPANASLQPHNSCFVLFHHLEPHHFRDTIGTCGYELLSLSYNDTTKSGLTAKAQQ